MDEPPFSPSTGERRFSLRAAGEVWSWRLTTPEGERVAGFAPDADAARRSAALAACVVDALTRARRRRP